MKKITYTRPNKNVPFLQEFSPAAAEMIKKLQLAQNCAHGFNGRTVKTSKDGLTLTVHVKWGNPHQQHHFNKQNKALLDALTAESVRYAKATGTKIEAA